jgi:hypothetical protein
MNGFERIARPADEAFEAWRRRNGRRAVFSVADDRPMGIDRWLECTTTCARCRRSRSVGPARLMLACVPFGFVAPWRDYPLLARCPSCGRVAWMQVRYPAAG